MQQQVVARSIGDDVVAAASSAPRAEPAKKALVVPRPEKRGSTKVLFLKNSSYVLTFIKGSVSDEEYVPEKKKVAVKKGGVRTAVAAPDTRINQHEWATVTSNCCIGKKRSFFRFLLIFQRV